MKSKSNKYKIIFINFVFLFLFLILTEIFYRGIIFSRSCKSSCDYKLLTFNPYTEPKFFDRIFHVDKVVGYKNKKNLKISFLDKNLSTDEFGLRKSNINNFKNKSSKKILTIGDSFAFGWEVSDEDTWQTCLNKKLLEFNFLNGGVGGYGTAQAIINAKNIYPQIKPNSLLVQTLVGSNFKRDQINRRMGIIKPYFISTNKTKTKIIYPYLLDENNLNKSSNFFDKFIVNITFLTRIKSPAFIKNLYYGSLNNIDPKQGKKVKGASSIIDIMRWSAKNSKELDSNVVWLFQYIYKSYPSQQRERAILKKILDEEEIEYIDTYDYFHGELSKDIDKKSLYMSQGHLSDSGNKLVCKAIIESGLYK